MPAALTPLVQIVIGLILLFLGRKAFWLFVAAVGFVAGFAYGPLLFHLESALTRLAVALAAGIIGALLAVVLRVLAIALAGFAAGGQAAVLLAGAVGAREGGAVWVIFIAGGILGAILLLLVFDWALIILSSILGAAVIIAAVDLGRTPGLLAFIVLAVAGLLVQGTVYVRAGRAGTGP